MASDASAHPDPDTGPDPVDTWSRERTNREFTEANVNGIEMDYWSAFRSRSRRFRGVLRESVGYANDAFGLRTRSNQSADEVDAEDEFPGQETRAQLAFGQQVDAWLAALLVGIVSTEAIRRGEHWTGGFVRRAYYEGLRFADRRAERLGLPELDVDARQIAEADFHRRLLAEAYLFQSTNIEDITTDIQRTLQRRVAEGLRDGWTPGKMADELTKEVRAIEGSRMLTQARTEPLKAHNRAALERFRERGVARVAIVNANPCPECRPFAGNVYPIRSVPFGGPPFHPNCRGIIVPAD